MPVLPKPNEIPVYLIKVDPGTNSPEFVFDHDKSKEIPPKVPIYMNDTNILIGTVESLADSVLYFEEGDDRGKGYYLHDAKRTPIDWVEKVKNSFHIKQSELAGGNGPQPPQVHPGLNEINNLVVGNEYEIVIQRPRQTQQHIYRGTLIHSPHQNVQDPTLKIINYTIDGVAQDGIRTFPDSWVIRVAEPLQQESPEPLGGGKKKKAKKTKKAKKMKKTKSKKAKKTGRKSIRRRR
jgi:hypothetical protein